MQILFYILDAIAHGIIFVIFCFIVLFLSLLISHTWGNDDNWF